MIRVKSIDHIVLRTAHPAAMIDFYSRVLACPVERDLHEELGLYQLRAGDALIDIVAVDSELGRPGGGPPTATANNLDHFCLQIEPFDEQELLDFLSDKLSRIEMPKMIEFRDELPKTIIGKLSKKELVAEEAAKRAASKK